MNWMTLMQQVNQAIYSNQNTPHQAENDPDGMVGNINQILGQNRPRAEREPSPDVLSTLFGQVQETIWNSPSTPHQPGNDPGNLMGMIGGLFNKYSQSNGMGKVLPASQDPYGDPADFDGRVLPASQDPYGDPADLPARGRGNVRPASQDPLGDPADQGW